MVIFDERSLFSRGRSINLDLLLSIGQIGQRSHFNKLKHDTVRDGSIRSKPNHSSSEENANQIHSSQKVRETVIFDPGVEPYIEPRLTNYNFLHIGLVLELDMSACIIAQTTLPVSQCFSFYG